MDRGRVTRGNRRGDGCRRGQGRGKRGYTGTVNQPPPPKRNQTDNLKKQTETRFQSIYPGYSMYFQSIPGISDFENKCAAVEKFLLSSTDLTGKFSMCENLMDSVKSPIYYSVNVDNIEQNDAFLKEWSNFNEELTTSPEVVINLWSLMAYKVVSNGIASGDVDSQLLGPSRLLSPAASVTLATFTFIRIGFSRSGPIFPLSDVNSSLIGKYITVKGVIVRMGKLYPLVAWMTFRCRKCKNTCTVHQPGGRFTIPISCETPDCVNKSSFEALEDAPTTVIWKMRSIRVQDTHYNSPGAVPKTVECILLGSLVEACTSGDAVTISGVVQTTLDPNNDSLHQKFVEVSAIQLQDETDRAMRGHMSSLSTLDYYAIQEVYDTPDLFRFLVTSLCPSIYGHELVKAGMLLSLLGGTPNDSKRSDINMLMIGDPGLGKSEMLKVATKIAPRGIYVCGHGSTAAGLTVTLVREGEDYTLEAGALVLADQGVCCIDEFDKMTDQHHSLLEAMEQQTVSVAKAGIYRTLPARVTLIAAANPTKGHYNPNIEFIDNVSISPALLSRFDLIFILLDTSDEKHDREVANHILGKSCSTRVGRAGLLRGTPLEVLRISVSEQNSNTDGKKQREVTLREYLKPKRNEVDDLLPHTLMRKYIAYAKTYVKPLLSPEAAEILKTYFISLRQQSRDSTPITSRQLESLVRLTQARAKAELRELATADDAKDVLEIFKFSRLRPMETHHEVKLSSATGSRKRMPKPLQFLKSLQAYAKKEGKLLLKVSEIKDIAAALGLEETVESLISKLNYEGDLIMKPGGIYQLISSSN